MPMEDIGEQMKMGYNESRGNSSRVRVPSPAEETPTMVVRNNNTNNPTINNNNMNIFRECLKNHAVDHGGHALDGCCEFLPGGPEGSLDALKCAACNCHRNFHRKEAPLPPIGVPIAAPIPDTVIPVKDVYPNNYHRHQATPPPQNTVFHTPKGLLHLAARPSDRPLISPARDGGGVGSDGGGEDHDDAMDTDNGGTGSSSNSKKRFRTKFTTEQKEKMKAFAERLDWRIQKHDDAVVQEFCNENGLKRQVLKVWMHNNKQTLGKKP